MTYNYKFTVLIIILLVLQCYNSFSTNDKYSFPNFKQKPLGKGYKIKSFSNPKKNSIPVQHSIEYLKLTRIPFRNQLNADLIFNDCKNKNIIDQLKPHQILNCIPGTNHLDYKSNYSKALKQLDQQNTIKNYNSSYANPEQYAIDFTIQGQLTESEQQFLKRNHKSGLWILKPSGAWLGDDIQMIHNITEFEQALKFKQKSKTHAKFNKISEFTLQKYIENPLLMDKRKIDYRLHVGMICSDPLIVVYFPGYFKKLVMQYDRNSTDKEMFVGNNKVQKNLQNYTDLIESDFFYDNKLFKYHFKQQYKKTEHDFDSLIKKSKAAITYALLATKDKFRKRKGDIEFQGVDFTIDKNGDPYLLEFNNLPYIGTDYPIFQQMFPDMVGDWLDASIALHEFSKSEIIEKSQQNPEFVCQFFKRLNCEILLNDAIKFNYLQDLDIKELYNNKQF